MKKKILSLFLCFIMVVCAFPTIAFATDSGEQPPVLKWQIAKSKTAEPTVLDTDDPVTKVTLSLASEEKKNIFDIVFVIDSSSSTIVEKGKSFTDYAMDMLNELYKSKANINVGVVGLKGYATDMIDRVSEGAHSGLLSLTEDGAYSTVVNALKEPVPGKGTNLHGGLQMAQSILEDSDTPVENQYLILLTDGKSYIWNDENGDPVSIYSQNYQYPNAMITANGFPVISPNMEYHKYSEYALPYTLRFPHFKALFASKHLHLTGKSPYETEAYYTEYYSGKSGVYVTGTSDIGTVRPYFFNALGNIGWIPSYPFDTQYYDYDLPEGYPITEYPYLEANPYITVKNYINNTFTYTGMVNPHSYFWNIGSLEKGTYMAAKLFDKLNQKYHCGVIINVNQSKPWENSPHIATLIYDNSNQEKTNNGFCNWLCKQAEFSIGITKHRQPSLEGKNSNVAEFFENIKDEILYLMAHGRVLDQIGDDFELVIPENNASPFKLVVGEEVLEAKATGEKEWSFGEIVPDTEYRYVVQYEKDAPNQFEWIINTPVKNGEPISLSYDLRLKESVIAEQEPDTTVEYPTNKLTELTYFSSNGAEGKEEFESPKVSYGKGISYFEVKIPVIKTVKRGGSSIPGRATFTFELFDFAHPEIEKELKIEGAELTTNGTGTYSAEITIRGKRSVFDQLREGFWIKEKNAGKAHWKYDKAEYAIRFDEDGNIMVGEKGEKKLISPVTPITFTNTYTYSSGGGSSYTLTLKKVDADDTNTVLAGARFDLYRVGKEEDRKVGSYTTNSNGRITASVSTSGSYYWLETLPPAGYTLDSKTKHTTATTSDKSDIVVKNKKTGTPGELNSGDHYAYMIGYEDGLIRPEANITRAEVAAIFFRLLKEDVRNEALTKTNSFSDIENMKWFCTPISTMAKMGILEGYPNGEFNPNGEITRAEFAAIASRFDKGQASSAAAFTDLAGHWAEAEIRRATELGWITGYEDSTFKPNQAITRAEVMGMVNRVLNRNPKAVDDLYQNMITWPDNMDTGKWYYLDVQEATSSHGYERRTNHTEFWTKINKNPDWMGMEK